MELEVQQQASHMCDGFLRVDADLEALDGWISCHKVERGWMLNRLASLEQTINLLVELGAEKDRQINQGTPSTSAGDGGLFVPMWRDVSGRRRSRA